MLGTGKVIPTLVIFTISVMMIFSILPVYAHHDLPSHTGFCKGPQWTPFELIDEAPEKAVAKDRNNNGWVCSKPGSNGFFMFKDDNPIKVP